MALAVEADGKVAFHIIDRRLNPGGKSVENRQRFLRRAKSLVQAAVKKTSQDRDIKDVLEGGIAIPLDGMHEPRFRCEGGTRDMVLPGNKKFVEGDMLPRSGDGAREWRVRTRVLWLARPYRKSNPDILMMQPAEAAPRYLQLVESSGERVHPCPTTGACEPQDNSTWRRCRSPNTTVWSRHSRRIERIRRSAWPFCHGERGGVGWSRMPSERTRRMKIFP
jgi:Protein of unknown function (DUF444)